MGIATDHDSLQNVEVINCLSIPSVNSNSTSGDIHLGDNKELFANRANISITQLSDTIEVPSPNFEPLSNDDDDAVIFLEENKNQSNLEYNQDVFFKRIKQKTRRKLRKKYQNTLTVSEN